MVWTNPSTSELQTRDVKKPDEEELLIKNYKTLISIGTEMTVFSGDYPENSAWGKMFSYPFEAGYAAVGEVIEIGKGVDKFWLGRRVASNAHHCCYETMSVTDVRLIQRDEVTYEEAVYCIIAQIVMRGIRLSKVQWGNSVVVFGVGLLGQFAVRFCRLSGARPVFAVDPADFRLNLLPDDSSMVKINPLSTDVAGCVSENTRGRMSDTVFEATGNGRLIPEEFKVLHEQGRFVVISSLKKPTEFDFHDLCNRPSHTIIGAHNFSHPSVSTYENPWTAKRHCELFFDLVADGELDVKRMTTHRVDYKDAPGIYYKLLEDRSLYMGIVIDWKHAG
jgi:2-desacetyl-2-hydroxyethyl bacteriochlorophyllide A dehydrogenase